MDQESLRQARRIRSSATQLIRLARKSKARPENIAHGQLFDRLLLSSSPLYRRSRALYLKAGGKFEVALISSARTLSSPTLIDPLIQYTPVEKEFIWNVEDPIERKNVGNLLSLRSYSGSLFHEQNHRILWKLLPAAPGTPAGCSRFLNFAESLVIGTDMALGDELGPKLADLLYQCGTIYDPGSKMKSIIRDQRGYRNYLHALIYATYLNLEFYDDKSSSKILRALYPNVLSLEPRITERAFRLDHLFVHLTNPGWQRKHRREVMQKMSAKRLGRESLELAAKPTDNRVFYLWAERWLDYIGL
jgi:hypothetical protein